MTRKIRTLIISLDSALTDSQWFQFISEITEPVEQAACDLAANCEDDSYHVKILK